MLTLINEFEIGRKYGKTMTINEVKYDLEEFKKMLMDNEEFYAEIKAKIIDKINNVELKTEEHVED
jgi:hypothetical protein